MSWVVGVIIISHNRITIRLASIGAVVVVVIVVVVVVVVLPVVRRSGSCRQQSPRWAEAPEAPLPASWAPLPS